LADLRETQFLLERVAFRLARLEEYHGQGLGDGEIAKGITTAAFFNRFDKDLPELAANWPLYASSSSSTRIETTGATQRWLSISINFTCAGSSI
jgi:hypothetical protein